MDHSYYKEAGRIPGFQVITDAWRSAPEHSYVKEPPKTPKHEKRKRGVSTPTGMTPQQLSKKTFILEESNKHMTWSAEEKQYLRVFKGQPRKGDESETKFWERCASTLNAKNPDKKRTGSSCKSAARRMCLLTKDLDDSADSFPSLDSMGQSDKTVADVAVQTDWSFSASITKSQPKEGEWVFVEHRKTLLKNTSESVESINQTALKRLRRYADLKAEERVSMIETLSSCTSRDAACKLLSSPIGGNILLEILYDIENDAKECCTKDSALYQKQYTDISSFKWESIIEELVIQQPTLAEVLLAVALPAGKIGSSQAVKSVMPVIGTVYCMLMKQRYHELSALQKIVAITLANEQTNQKVYDRLQPLGITLSHSGMLYTMEKISGHFNSELIDSLKEGKTFRLVGDNINFQIGVSHERKSVGKSGHMEHWFGSAAIVQTLTFNNLCDRSPQCDLLTLPVSTVLLDNNDWGILIKDMTLLVARTLTECFPWLKFARRAAKKEILGEYSQDLHFKNKVIPLPIMAKNEQKYAEVVDILDSYETLVTSVHEKAGLQPKSVHIGGDQLTRERFSGSKRLRAAALSPLERFTHLSPITFELFHLQMTVLSCFYQNLYQTTSNEPFTLHAQKIRLMRKDADGNDVKNHYNHCKELAISFIKAYIVEAACDYFEVEDTVTVPNIAIPDTSSMSEADIQDWLSNLLKPMVTDILSSSRSHLEGLDHNNIHHKGCDHVSDYAKIVVELGLVYMELNDIVKLPNRNRLLAIMKFLMLILKGHNNKSKYALEILRFLCQQYALLSERVANSSLYGLFVNVGGEMNTHIPADLQMEYLVRLTKGHLKSMCSNVTEASMKKRSSAFFGMQEICDNFDNETQIVKRAQKHRTISSYEDEMHIVSDLRTLRPFKHNCGRRIYSLKKVPKNPVTKAEIEDIVKWIETHKVNMYYELGQ